MSRSVILDISSSVSIYTGMGCCLPRLRVGVDFLLNASILVLCPVSIGNLGTAYPEILSFHNVLDRTLIININW